MSVLLYVLLFIVVYIIYILTMFFFLYALGCFTNNYLAVWRCSRLNIFSSSTGFQARSGDGELRMIIFISGKTCVDFTSKPYTVVLHGEEAFSGATSFLGIFSIIKILIISCLFLSFRISHTGDLPLTRPSIEVARYKMLRHESKENDAPERRCSLTIATWI